MAQPINNEYEKELDRTGLELVALASDKQAIEMELLLEPNDSVPSKMASVREKRQQFPVPGERPNIWQLMNQVRVRQQRRAEKGMRI